MARVEPAEITQANLQPKGKGEWSERGGDSIALVAILGTEKPRWPKLLGAVLLAGTAFHVAWIFPPLNAFVLVYAWALLFLADGGSKARGFRLGFLAGFLVFAPQLAWFWNIFGLAAVCLWAVLSFFTGIFVLLLRCWKARFGSKIFWLVAPVLWCGIEYFRSELYVLKFSWLSAGYLFAERPGVLPVSLLGVYGIGFVIFLGAAISAQARIRAKLAIVAAVLLLANFPRTDDKANGGREVKVAGIQLEFPVELELPTHLDRVLRMHPDAQVLVLSEYAFDGPVPNRVKDWCRRNGRYLIAGGKEDATENGVAAFRNTAFVIGPNGEVIFRQGKSVPIQFFNDGLAATEQRVWDSPWGKIAIPICYDLSYRRVTDRFVTAGAEAFIVPFMDVTDWGRQQHEQHARIAPNRAREYALSMFRLGSSGISQNVSRSGKVLADAEFPGQGQVIAGTLQFSAARMPLDHWLAPACSVATVFLITTMCFGRKFKSFASDVRE